MIEKEEIKYHRKVVSFIKRQGRASNRQAQALDKLWEKYGINFKNKIINQSELFPSTADLVVEIGFGMGCSLVTVANHNPDVNYLGIEVHSPGVGNVLANLHEKQLTNLKVIQEDAMLVLKHMIADGSLSKLQVYFPDPWHKTRHKKRRLVKQEFLDLIACKLKPNGIIHLATDWEDYAIQMMDLLSNDLKFENKYGNLQYAPDKCGRVETKFEARGKRLGHGIWDLLFERVNDLSL